MAIDVNELYLVKGEERFLFYYTDERASEVLRTLGRFASDPDINFTWYDAAIMNQKVRHAMEASKANKPRFHLPCEGFCP